MNLEFGEINEPSSRAFWDDFDNLGISDFQLPMLNWEWNQSKIDHPIKTLLIIEAPSAYINGLTKTIFQNQNPISQLNNYKAQLFQFPEDDTVVCLSEHQDPKLSGLASIKFVPLIEKAENMIILNIQHTTMHKGNSTDATKHLHFIQDLVFRNESVIKLEAPNIIYGLSAGVASLCKHLCLPFSCYIAYLDNFHVDGVSIWPILTLLTKIGVQFNQKLQFKVPDTNESNLYT